MAKHMNMVGSPLWWGSPCLLGHPSGADYDQALNISL